MLAALLASRIKNILSEWLHPGSGRVAVNAWGEGREEVLVLSIEHLRIAIVMRLVKCESSIISTLQGNKTRIRSNESTEYKPGVLFSAQSNTDTVPNAVESSMYSEIEAS